MKKFVVWACLLFAGRSLVFSQIQNGKDFSSRSISSSWISKSVRQSLYVVNSSYKVQDESGQLFDREGRSDFNNHFLLGVQVGQALVLPEASLLPWKNDTVFSSYMDRYVPVLHRIEKRHIDKKNYLRVESDSLLCNQANGICLFYNEEPGLSCQNDIASVVSGYIVWVVSPDSPGKCDSTHLIINKYTGANNNIVDGPEISKIDELLSLGRYKQIIGGVFVVPSFSEPGVVRFSAVAMLHRSQREMGKWEVSFITDHQEDDKEKDELVPSKNNRNQKPSRRLRKK